MQGTMVRHHGSAVLGGARRTNKENMDPQGTTLGKVSIRRSDRQDSGRDDVRRLASEFVQVSYPLAPRQLPPAPELGHGFHSNIRPSLFRVRKAPQTLSPLPQRGVHGESEVAG